MEFVRRADEKLMVAIREWRTIEDIPYSKDDAQYAFESAVIVAAKKFGIKPISTLKTGSLPDYSDTHYKHFGASLSEVLTETMLDIAERSRGDSIALPDASKQSIRTIVAHLRAAIEREDLTNAKRAALNRHLDALEQELTRKRIRYLVIARVLVEILAIPGAMAESYDAASKLATYIMRELGSAKGIEHEQRQLTSEEPAGLIPHAKVDTEPEPDDMRNFDRQDRDNEIPF
jgi:hypothetical protein